MNIATTKKKKQLLIAVIVFLIVQFINLGFASLFTTDLSMFTGDFKQLEEKQNQKVFDNLLATQTLHLEGKILPYNIAIYY